MGIELEERNNIKEISQLVVNKTLLYVALMTNKTKKTYGNAFMNPEPYNQILQYTSHSYLTGKPGMTEGEWAILRKQAIEAKQAMLERAKMQKAKRRFFTQRISSVTGGKTALTGRGLARQLRKEDAGILANLDMDELLRLAGKYGIDPNKFKHKNIDRLKAEIYNAIAYDTKLTERLERRQSV